MHSTTNIINKNDNILFMLAWTFFSLGFVLYRSVSFDAVANIQTFYIGMSFVSCILLLLKFVQDRTYRLSELIIYFLFIVISLCIYLNTFDETFIIGILFLFCSKNIDFRKLVSYDLKLKICIFVLIQLLCKAGILENKVILFYGTIYKQTMGFGHPNTFGLYCYVMLIEWLFLRHQIMKLLEWILVFVVATWVYGISGSRSSAYTFVIIYLLFFILAKIPRVYQFMIIKKSFIFITPMMVTLVFGIISLYQKGSKFAEIINIVMTGRIRLSYMYINQHGFSIFGAHPENDYYLDIGYVRCLVVYGILYGLLLLLFYTLLMKFLMDTHNYAIAVYALFFVIYALGESLSFYPIYNLSLLLLPNMSNIYKISSINNRSPNIGELKI